MIRTGLALGVLPSGATRIASTARPQPQPPRHGFIDS